MLGHQVSLESPGPKNRADNCSLAYAQIYLTVAALIRNFDMELVDSSVKNVEIHRDFAMGFTEDRSFGVQFKVTKVRE